MLILIIIANIYNFEGKMFNFPRFGHIIIEHNFNSFVPVSLAGVKLYA